MKLYWRGRRLSIGRRDFVVSGNALESVKNQRALGAGTRAEFSVIKTTFSPNEIRVEMQLNYPTKKPPEGRLPDFRLKFYLDCSA